MSRFQPATVALLVGSLGLSGCGGGGDASKGAFENGVTAFNASQSLADKKAVTSNISEGPDVCFRAIAKQIGADTKVSEINAFFSSGSEIDSDDEEPKGQLTTCSVEYQNPADARKLLGTSLDMRTGAFSPPRPIEISVTGGNAADFKLEEYLIPLSKVNAIGLTAIMAAQTAKMEAIYSRYAWSGVRLMAPGPFSNVHTLRLDVEGRLKSNDIKESGYASISTDGKTVITDNLKP